MAAVGGQEGEVVAVTLTEISEELANLVLNEARRPVDEAQMWAFLESFCRTMGREALEAERVPA